MTSSERERGLLISYVSKRAEKIKEETLEAIRGYMSSARASLDFIMEDLEAQSRTFEIIPTIKLIETIAAGGFIRSEERTLKHEGWLSAEVRGETLFRNQVDHGRITLLRGKYRFTLLVERLGDVEG